MRTLPFLALALSLLGLVAPRGTQADGDQEFETLRKLALERVRRGRAAIGLSDQDWRVVDAEAERRFLAATPIDQILRRSTREGPVFVFRKNEFATVSSAKLMARYSYPRSLSSVAASRIFEWRATGVWVWETRLKGTSQPWDHSIGWAPVVNVDWLTPGKVVKLRLPILDHEPAVLMDDADSWSLSSAEIPGAHSLEFLGTSLPARKYWIRLRAGDREWCDQAWTTEALRAELFDRSLTYDSYLRWAYFSSEVIASALASSNFCVLGATAVEGSGGDASAAILEAEERMSSRSTRFVVSRDAPSEIDPASREVDVTIELGGRWISTKERRTASGQRLAVISGEQAKQLGITVYGYNEIQCWPRVEPERTPRGYFYYALCRYSAAEPPIYRRVFVLK